MENMFQQRDRWLPEIFNAVSDAIIVCDPGTGIIIDANKHACELFGYRYEEIVKTGVSSLSANEAQYTPDGLRRMMEGAGREQQKVFEWRVKDRAVRPFWAEISMVCVGVEGNNTVLMVLRDIGDRKRVEDDLKIRNLFLLTQVEASIDGILVVDKYEKIQSYNQRFVAMWNIPPGIIALKDDAPTLRFVMNQLADPAEFLAKVKYLYEHIAETSRDELFLADGKVFDRYSAPVIGSDGEYFGRIWYFRDITERKRSENALRESEAKYRAVVEKMQDVLYRTDNEGNFVMLSPSGARLLGLGSAEQAIGMNVAREFYADPKDRGAFLQAIETNGVLTDYEVRLKKRGDGSPVFVSVSSHFYRDADGNILGIEGIFRDITERKLLEGSLLQSQKMAAIGKLAGGIAHDFNNLLNVILGFSDLVLGSCRKQSQVSDNTKEIKKAAKKAAMLTSQLLAFSRKQPLIQSEVSLNRVVLDMKKMLRRLIRENIDLQVVLDPGLKKVFVDRSQQEQVIMNLVVNARDAMPDGGKLTITTEKVMFDSGSCRKSPEARPGEFVCLSVADTGYGMNPETLQHLFEPFFTTKKRGRGTGLGLSVIYGIVQQQEGWITVSSELGKGSVFKVYLPAYEGKGGKKSARLSRAAPGKGKGERILLVEDEQGTLKMVKQLLCKNKYVVFQAVNAEEALKIFRQEKGNFRLLFTDFVLPDRNGVELAKQIVSMTPGIKVLVSSGYLADTIQATDIERKGYHFLAKPYELRHVLSVVKNVLADSGSQ